MVEPPFSEHLWDQVWLFGQLGSVRSPGFFKLGLSGCWGACRDTHTVLDRSLLSSGLQSTHNCLLAVTHDCSKAKAGRCPPYHMKTTQLNLVARSVSASVTEGPDKLVFFFIYILFKEEGDQSKFNGHLWKPVTAIKMHVPKNRFAVWETRPYSTVNHRKTFDAYCMLQVRITFASFVQQTWKESDLYLLDLHHFHTIKRFQ